MPDDLKNTDNVSKKILEDAQHEANKIINEARFKAKEILEDARQKSSNKLKEAQAEASNLYERVFELEVSKVKAELKHKILIEKIRIIDSILKKTIEAVKSEKSGVYENSVKDAFKKLDIKEAEYQLGNKENLMTDQKIKMIAPEITLQKSKELPDFDSGIKIIAGKKEFRFSAEELIEAEIDDIRITLSRFIFGEE